MSPASKGNFVLAYARAEDGTLTRQGVFATGGTGAPLYGSHNALVVSASEKWLLVANTGSNDISVMQVYPKGLVLRGRVPSGGTAPVSLALWKDKLLYVANYESHEITGFLLSTDGRLTPLPNSTRPLPGQYSSAVDLQFTPDGSLLIASDMVNRLVDTFPMTSQGLAGTPTTMTSPADGPAGFTFGPSRSFYVAETGMGMPGAGSITTYQYTTTGLLKVVEASAATTQTATSSVRVIAGSFAYAINGGSGTISSFKVDPSGKLTALNPTEDSNCAGAQDMATSRDQQFLFVLSPSAVGICTYQIQTDGRLVYLPNNIPLPPVDFQGIAAR